MTENTIGEPGTADDKASGAGAARAGAATDPGRAPDGGDIGGPPIPDEIREAGRLAPDHWLGMVDPTWSGDGEPPEWAVVGRWRSGLDGEIEEWQDNPDYKPSPTALGWPEPLDEVDKAVQLAATGYGPGEDVTQALIGREVAIWTKSAGGPLEATTPDGTSVVPLFTSPPYLHAAGRLAFELVNVNDLVGQVPDRHALYLNPSAPVSMTLELDVLRDAISAAVGRARPVATVSLDNAPAGSAAAQDEGGQAGQYATGAEGAQTAEQNGAPRGREG